MKRLSYSVVTVVLVAGLSLSALSQAPKPADPCAEFKKAPKGESAADKKKRQAALKECTAKQKAAAKPSKQQTPQDSGKK